LAADLLVIWIATRPAISPPHPESGSVSKS
jgi:hypothetical protein